MNPEEEDIYRGLELWLKTRRDEWNGPNTGGREWEAVDALLDEVREAGAEGFLPWQREL